MRNFESIAEQATLAIAEKQLPEIYSKRLKFEFAEIKKQGSESYWATLFNENARYSENPNHLLFPWLLGMVDKDPLDGADEVITTSRYDETIAYYKANGNYPPGIKLDSDKPDIDIDFLPESKELIEQYVVNKYSAGVDDEYGVACSVSSWTTYKFKSAIVDVARAYQGANGFPQAYELEHIVKAFPDDVDEMKEGGFGFCRGSRINTETNTKEPCKTVFREAKCPKCGGSDTETPTLGSLADEIPELKKLHQNHPQLIDFASRLVGKIQGQGQHAGAMVISNEPLYGNLPLYSRNGKWMSLWTEGRVTQLSKYGFVKWDILGLLNLQYIYECCNAIKRNHGISFGDNLLELFDTDPDDDRLGWYIKPSGERVKIKLNDPGAFSITNSVDTDGIFQFDTPVAQNILKQCNSLSDNNAVRTIQDLISINALGHPGPMQMIPDFITNREDESGEWKKNTNPEFMKIIGETYNCIVFQEQLAALWQNIAGFTSVQAQDARKAVAKKWVDKLRPIEEMWMIGASKMIGEEEAALWWSKMVTFGRYAFNKSHALAYCLVAYTCCWLKHYFPLEFWGAVFSGADHKNRPRYIGSARRNKIEIRNYDINQLSDQYYAHCEPRENHEADYFGYLVPGLSGIKGFPKDKAEEFSKPRTYSSIYQFIEINGKDKKSYERLINLGAFDEFHFNRKALWMWYLYNYCSGPDVKALKAEVREKYYALTNRTEESIIEERNAIIDEYRLTNPKKKDKDIPKKILEWIPPINSKEVELFEDLYADYTYSEILKLEDEHLGLYMHSPMHEFSFEESNSLANVAYNDTVDCVLVSATRKMTKATEKQTSKPYILLSVYDGIQTGSIFIWNDSMKSIDSSLLKPGTGLRIVVNYSDTRNQISMARGTPLMVLKKLPAKSWRDVVSNVRMQSDNN